MIQLTKLQKEIMSEFYDIVPAKVIFNRSQRRQLWSQATAKTELENLIEIENVCPALAHQIKRSYESNRNIQSAVFSECVYAQTLANMLNLNRFINCFENADFIPSDVGELLRSYCLTPRYVYSNDDCSRMLVQAGGCNGIDSALITVNDLRIYTIEFKEPGAKTSEPDLPKYGEDGKLLITAKFVERYPQFEAMLREKMDLNFFELMGNNEHDFSAESVNIAVSNNYTKKYADVVCTEDTNGHLVMLPVNQISLWASIEGEIRPAGRNHYDVWTPKALRKFLTEKGAKIVNDTVEIDRSQLRLRRQRGGNGRVSGYKINPLFFVYLGDCVETDNIVKFNLGRVQQLKPTIAGKMHFGSLRHDKVKEYYFASRT